MDQDYILNQVYTMDQMHLASNIFLGTFGVELLNRPEHYPHPVLRSVKLFDDFRHSLKSCCKSWVWMEGKEKKLDEKELSVKKVKTTKFRADLLERRKVPLFSFYNSEKMSQISQKAFDLFSSLEMLDIISRKY